MPCEHDGMTGLQIRSITAACPTSKTGRQLLSPSHSSVVMFEFQGGPRCVPRHPGASISTVLEEEWGVSEHQCTAKVNGRHVSMATSLDAIPVGASVRVVGKLRGGAPSHSKKLRELLSSKGLPDDEIPGRFAEIMAVVGENGLADTFNCFDPWQALKAKCHGKVRIVKQSEARQKPKKPDDEVDPLQVQDPWAAALQARHLRPDAAFFQTAASTSPAILSSVTNGASGIAIVDEKEACLLAQATDDLSPDE